MPKYTVLAEAQEDLKAIRRYTISNCGQKQANSYIAELLTAFQLLASQPSLGRDRSNDLGNAYRSYICNRHVVYYQKTQKGVAIGAILHQSMTPENHLPRPMADNSVPRPVEP
jgi:toxin ParE1/3/4